MSSWPPPSSARSLGVMRALFYGYLFLRMWETDFAVWGHAPHALWRPHLTFQLLGLQTASPALLSLLSSLLKVCILTSCLGLFTRFSTTLVAMLSFYLFGLESCYGLMSHDFPLLVLSLVVLACARCGDAFSLDSLRGSQEDWPEKHFAYSWPPLMIQILVCNMFFWAGVSKLTAAGLSWGGKAELEFLLLAQSVQCSDWTPLNGAPWLLEHLPGMVAILGPATLFLELGMPLALLGPRWRALFGSLGFLFLVGVRLTLGPNFLTVAGLFLFWIPWDSLQILRAFNIFSTKNESLQGRL